MLYLTLLDLEKENNKCKMYNDCSVSKSNMIPTSMISEYDLGGEGDLFKAPEPIIEESLADVDPMTAAISMMSCGDEVMSSQGLKAADIESIQTEHLLSEVFYECKKDLMQQANIETPLSEILDIKMPVMRTDGIQIEDNKFLPDASLLKSVSAECLRSIEYHGPSMTPGFLDFSGMDFGTAFGMRRAYSEGDIKSPCNRPLVIGICIAEQRREQLSRYRNKKMKRNFGRKIKYACRKALADSQPRIRGRFAKTDESNVSKRQ